MGKQSHLATSHNTQCPHDPKFTAKIYPGEKFLCLGSDVGRNPDGDSWRVRPLKRSPSPPRQVHSVARYDYAEEDLGVRLMERRKEGREEGRGYYLGQD